MSALTLSEYVIGHTQRGECECGRCVDRGDRPDPEGHTVDMVFFKVAAKGDPSIEEFRRLTGEHRGEFAEADPLDGREHNYLDLGGWIGDQGLAMQYMALGVLLGAFELLSPRMIPGISDEQVRQMASFGLLSVKAPAP